MRSLKGPILVILGQYLESNEEQAGQTPVTGYDITGLRSRRAFPTTASSSLGRSRRDPGLSTWRSRLLLAVLLRRTLAQLHTIFSPVVLQ